MFKRRGEPQDPPGEGMKQLQNAPVVESTVRDRADSAATKLPLLRSEDQKFFNESLRAGVKGMGELVRKRRKRG